MEPFKTHTGLLAVLNRGNIDTDQIISKEHLKSIRRTGYGEHLFSDWRYLDNGNQNPSFELNNPGYQNASILVTGNNFGCGSSREHAVWAIVQYGFKVVIAPKKQSGADIIPGFADIFRNNSTKNGLLLIELTEDETNVIIKAVNDNPKLTSTVNLIEKTILLNVPGASITIPFPVDASVRQKFLDGLDEIGLTEKYLDQIQKFEQTHSAQLGS